MGQVFSEMLEAQLQALVKQLKHKHICFYLKKCLSILKLLRAQGLYDKNFSQINFLNLPSFFSSTELYTIILFVQFTNIDEI